MVEADGAVDSNSPMAVAEEATRVVEVVATKVDSRVVTIKTSSKVVVNGRRRSNPSYEFSLTSLENPKPGR